MKKLSGAEMVVQSLRDEGVEYLFGYPGGCRIGHLRLQSIPLVGLSIF